MPAQSMHPRIGDNGSDRKSVCYTMNCRTSSYRPADAPVQRPLDNLQGPCSNPFQHLKRWDVAFTQDSYRSNSRIQLWAVGCEP